ncbi:MAG: ABC transporter substrate-binding protein [Candidatus Pacebacteria bacterium]|nr:ABC transporter substrate-binding protein [Candidatus Paceibacterota bacterium]
MNKKILIVGAVIIVILLIIILIPKKSDGNTIKIGHIDFVTGPLASIGEAAKKGAELAVEDINAAGGIKGKKVEYLVEDYAYDGKKVIPSYEALMNKGIQYLIVEGSTAAAILNPIAKEKKQFMLVPSAFTPVWKDGNPLTCRIALTADSYGAATADYLLKHFNKPKIAILVSNNEYGKGMMDVLSKGVEAGGGKVVITDTYEQAGGDFRTQLTKIKGVESQLDAVFTLNSGASVEPLFKEIKELKITKPIISDTSTVSNSNLKDRSLVEGVVYSDYPLSPMRSDDDTPKAHDMKERYFQKFGEEPGTFSVQSYDAMMILARAIEDSDDTLSQGISDFLIHKIGTYEGVNGKFTFNNDCEVDRPVVMRVVKDGKPVLLTQ